MFGNKKNVIIAIFLVLIMVLTPSATSLKLSLTSEDKKEFNQKTSVIEDENLKTRLDNLVSDSSIDINEVEEEIKLYVENGKNPVLETITWQWIKNRLGWVYHTAENITMIYQQSSYLVQQFSYKYSVITGWFNSIKNVRTSWSNYKSNPNLVNLFDVVKNVQTAATLTLTLIEDISDEEQELITGFQNVQSQLSNFSVFLQSEPWKKSIEIFGEVTGIENATVSCPGDQVNITNGTYNLTYVTADQRRPWSLHKITTTVSYDEKETKKEARAFSMGRIELNFDIEEENNQDNLMKYPFLKNLLNKLISLFPPDLFF